MVLHSSEHELFLTAAGEAKLSLRSMVGDEAVRRFFTSLVSDCLDLDDWSARKSNIAVRFSDKFCSKRVTQRHLRAIYC